MLSRFFKEILVGGTPGSGKIKFDTLSENNGTINYPYNIGQFVFVDKNKKTDISIQYYNNLKEILAVLTKKESKKAVKAIQNHIINFIIKIRDKML